MKENALILYTPSTNTPRACWWVSHPWVYENDILHARTRTRKRRPGRCGQPQGGVPGHRLRVAAQQDPGAAHQPQRQRHLDAGFLAPPGGVRLGLLQDRAGACRPDRLPIFGELTSSRPDRGPLPRYPGHPDPPQRGHGKSSPVLFPCWPRCCGPTARPLPASTSETTRPLRAKEGLEQNKGWSDSPGETHPPAPRPRSARTACSTMWTLRTARKPAFSLDQKYNCRAVAMAGSRPHGAGLLHRYWQLCAERRRAVGPAGSPLHISADAIAMAPAQAPNATA